jgi:phosphopantothenate synthetase
MCYTCYVHRNLTLTIDDDLLRAARKMALDRNTSVNQLVRDYLNQLVSETDKRKAAVERLEDIFQKHSVKIGPITWTREELHER